MSYQNLVNAEYSFDIVKAYYIVKENRFYTVVTLACPPPGT